MRYFERMLFSLIEIEKGLGILLFVVGLSWIGRAYGKGSQRSFFGGGFHITLVILFFLDNLKCAGLPKERVLYDLKIGLYYNVYDRIYKKKKAGFSLEPILFD